MKLHKICYLAIMTLTFPSILFASGYGCQNYQIGSNYVVVDSSSVYMSRVVDRGIGRGDRIYVSNNDTFKIKEIDFNSYLVDLGYASAYYLCSGLDLDMKISVIENIDKYKSKIEKVNKIIGDKLWLTDSIVSLYTNYTLKEPLRITKPQEATVDSVKIGYREGEIFRNFYYKVFLSAGATAYISDASYDEAVSTGKIIKGTEEIARAKVKADEEEKIRIEAAKTEEDRKTKELALKKEEEQAQFLEKQSEIISELKKNGIYTGKTLWLKYPKLDMPGLTKIKITDVVLEKKEEEIWPEHNEVKKIIITISYADNRVSELIYENYLKEIAEDFYKENVGAKWGKRALTAIANGKIFIGMTKPQVIASWDKPSDINRTVGSWGTHEQWIYGSNYLYFENGILKSWQD